MQLTKVMKCKQELTTSVGKAALTPQATHTAGTLPSFCSMQN